MAEKDLAMTVADLDLIITIEHALFAEHAVSSWEGEEPYTPAYFAELLRRVNEARNNK